MCVVNQSLWITLDTELLLLFTPTLAGGEQLSTDRWERSGKICQFLATLKVWNFTRGSKSQHSFKRLLYIWHKKANASGILFVLGVSLAFLPQGKSHCMWKLWELSLQLALAINPPALASSRVLTASSGLHSFPVSPSSKSQLLLLSNSVSFVRTEIISIWWGCWSDKGEVFLQPVNFLSLLFYCMWETPHLMCITSWNVMSLLGKGRKINQTSF